jgi:predicted Zn-dependent protease
MLTLFILSFSVVSSAGELPLFFDSIEQELFFPNGMKEWTLEKQSDDDDNHSLFQWKNPSRHEITLEYRNATPNTIENVYQGMGKEIDKQINEVGGKVLTLNFCFAVILINDTRLNHSVNLLYGTPEGAYWWKYKVPNTLNTDYETYISNISSVAREHQYKVALEYGNVTMGRWGVPVHEFAKQLATQNDPRVKTVYKKLLQTSPANYDAQMEFTRITKDRAEAVQSAKIVERDAEEESLLNASAKILNRDIPSISSYPLLEAKDKGLKVILIPLPPCNPWLLDEIAATYERITTIPVVIKRLPVDWAVPQPSRSAYRPYLEKIASNIWKTKSDFSDWSLSKLKDEIMKSAEKEGPQAVATISQIFKKMSEAGYQWDAAPIIDWVSKTAAPYYSKDPNTMVVGITELDIFSEETNFVFSLYARRNDMPVSILSYARMRAKFTGENQSRKRLTERAAIELVPASLKELGIPRSMDPSCPYSYSSGLQRLKEKTLNLSEPVKKEIERIKSSI